MRVDEERVLFNSPTENFIWRVQHVRSDGYGMFIAEVVSTPAHTASRGYFVGRMATLEEAAAMGLWDPKQKRSRDGTVTNHKIGVPKGRLP